MPYKDPERKRARHRVYMREVWYPQNRERQYALTKQRERRLREFVSSLKVKCRWCEESHPATLDFHHNGRKGVNMTQVVKLGWGKERILREVAKCTVLCANCHRKLHWEERQDNNPKVAGSSPAPAI